MICYTFMSLMIIYWSLLFLQILCCFEAFKHVRESRKNHANNCLDLLSNLLNATSKFLHKYFQKTPPKWGKFCTVWNLRRKSATEMNVLKFEVCLLLSLLGSDGKLCLNGPYCALTQLEAFPSSQVTTNGLDEFTS